MDIRDIINAHLEVLKELNELLDYEKEVLIKDRASELPQILEKKKLIAQKISFIEKKRNELTGTKKADELITAGLLTQKLVDEVKKLTETVQEKSEVNLILTRQSIYYIRMITSALNPAVKVPTYGSSGSLDDGASVNVFTTKA
jgi:flagellar biosynthesis/type III secretory pathway chaperone